MQFNTREIQMVSRRLQIDHDFDLSVFRLSGTHLYLAQVYPQWDNHPRVSTHCHLVLHEWKETRANHTIAEETQTTEIASAEGTGMIFIGEESSGIVMPLSDKSKSTSNVLGICQARPTCVQANQHSFTKGQRKKGRGQCLLMEVSDGSLTLWM